MRRIVKKTDVFFFERPKELYITNLAQEVPTHIHQENKYQQTKKQTRIENHRKQCQYHPNSYKLGKLNLLENSNELLTHKILNNITSYLPLYYTFYIYVSCM